MSNEGLVGEEASLDAEALGVIDNLVDLTAELGLPVITGPLLRLRDRLRGGSYLVLVGGEAKSGKSSFVNALIGQPLLPTDVEIATSQAFTIRSAPEESFRLRLEDGSAFAIGREELPRYGSQVEIDKGGGVTVRQDVQWIEVELPAPFLPNRVCLLDTPGVGALYAAHAQITRRFVPLADAVIVMLDSGRPLSERELEFVEGILGTTRRVFFIQTKIDQHAKVDWHQTLDRNERILAERFGDQLGAPRVWPISSRNLSSAADSVDAEALLMVSRYPALAAELSSFLEATCAVPRAVEALLFAARHQQTAQPVLIARLEELSNDPASASTAPKEQIAVRWRDFQSTWGEQGRERLALERAVRRVTTLGKQAFREAMAPGGAVLKSQEQRIDAITSVEEGNRLGHELGQSLVTAAMDEWARVCALASREYGQVLAPFMEAADKAIQGTRVTQSDVEVAFVDLSDPIYDRLRRMYGHASPIYMVSGIVLSIIANPFVIVAAAGGMLWTLAAGWRQGGEARAKAGRVDLQRHLRNVHSEVHAHFFAVDLDRARFSRVDEYFNQVEEQVLNLIAEQAHERMTQLRGEFALLEAQAQLDDEERTEAADAARAAIAEWQRLGARIGALLDDDRAASHLAELAMGAAQGSGRGAP